jgi:hypothetical protein
MRDALGFLSLAIDYGSFFSSPSGISFPLHTDDATSFALASLFLPYHPTFPSILISCSPITPARKLRPPPSNHITTNCHLQSHHPHPRTLRRYNHVLTHRSSPPPSPPPNHVLPIQLYIMVGKPGADRAVPTEHPNSEQLGPSTAAANAGPPGHTQYGHRWNTACIGRLPRHRHRRGRHCFCGGHRCAKCAKCGQRG